MEPCNISRKTQKGTKDKEFMIKPETVLMAVGLILVFVFLFW